MGGYCFRFVIRKIFGYMSVVVRCMNLESISAIILSSSSGYLNYLNNKLKYLKFSAQLCRLLSTINLSLNHQ